MTNLFKNFEKIGEDAESLEAKMPGFTERYRMVLENKRKKSEQQTDQPQGFIKGVTLLEIDIQLGGLRKEIREQVIAILEGSEKDLLDRISNGSPFAHGAMGTVSIAYLETKKGKLPIVLKTSSCQFEGDSSIDLKRFENESSIALKVSGTPGMATTFAIIQIGTQGIPGIEDSTRNKQALIQKYYQKGDIGIRPEDNIHQLRAELLSDEDILEITKEDLYGKIAAIRMFDVGGVPLEPLLQTPVTYQGNQTLFSEIPDERELTMKQIENVLSHASILQKRRCGEITLELIKALNNLHEMGYIHRDIKLANVLFGDQYPLVITDFGLATNNKAQKESIQLTEEEAEQLKRESAFDSGDFFTTLFDGLTKEGGIVGTRCYMAPELFLAAYQREKNEWAYSEMSDMYAAFACFYELLTHRLPFGNMTNKNGDEIRDMVRYSIGHPETVSKALARWREELQDQELFEIFQLALHQNPQKRAMNLPVVIDRLEKWSQKPVTQKEIEEYNNYRHPEYSLPSFSSRILSSEILLDGSEEGSGLSLSSGANIPRDQLLKLGQDHEDPFFDPNAETRVHSSLLDSKEIETLMELGGKGIDEWEENTYARKADLKERRT